MPSAIITGLFTLAAVALTHWLRNRHAAKEEQIEYVAQCLLQAGHVTNELLADTGAARVALLKAHNGGEELKAGHNIYSTMLSEEFHPDQPSLRDHWQNHHVDYEYTALLERLLRERNVRLAVSEMSDCELKNLCLSHDVLQSHVVLLWANKPRSRILYLHVDYVDPKDLDAPRLQEAMRVAVSRLEHLMKKAGPYL